MRYGKEILKTTAGVCGVPSNKHVYTIRCLSSGLPSIKMESSG